MIFQFKAAVYPKLSLEMMKHDVYLLRWIRAKNLDVQLAERDILEMVKFVRVNKIENIMEEDFGDIMDEFPYHMDIVSFKLSPTPTIHVLLNMLRPFFSESTNRALKIFGPNKTKWKPYLDARIDPNKLPEQFGGNRLDR
ncbi:SEC14-like protein 3 [Orchesella cincta]|uniref:SEC14-like protein 3 n=1 Tax=Orchesella cincta TaxID=48709 RepID=A0A1D2M795_ORCCI|nr:SEC14-like protein 3 [Orchesella cincta]